MDPVSASILGGVSVGSGILGLFGTKYQSDNMLKATRETNEQNYKIWQEQRAHNVDMWNMQNKANIDMWNMQNAYNDPSAVMQRWLDAGVSPYMALGQMGGAGVSSSAPQSATMAQAQAPTMQAPPIQAFESPLKAFVDSMRETALASSQIALQSKQGDNIDANTEGTIIDNLWKPQLHYENWESLHNQNSLNRLTQWIEYDNRKETLRALRISNSIQQIDLETQNEALRYMPAQTAVNFLSTLQGYANAYVSGKISWAQYHKTFQEYSNAVKTGLNLDLKNDEQKMLNDVTRVNTEWSREILGDAKGFDEFVNAQESKMISNAVSEAFASKLDAVLNKSAFNIYSDDNSFSTLLRRVSGIQRGNPKFGLGFKGGFKLGGKGKLDLSPFDILGLDIEGSNEISLEGSFGF